MVSALILNSYCNGDRIGATCGADKPVNAILFYEYNASVHLVLPWLL